ncbi:MAG: acyltransferase [Candidatus Puniceispirillum sp.]|nr:acyltransferase [Candidatus Puniceispirillum sp.]
MYNSHLSYFLKKIIIFISSFFYDPKYFKGKYFEEKVSGWMWLLIGIKNKILGFNINTKFPVHPSTNIHNCDNIQFDIDDLHIFQVPGCYYNNFSAKIFLGKGTYIAPNVGIITANHDFDNLSKHLPGKDVTIGDNCWIGMNSVILPGVELGNNTIVGAGSIVTKSFKEGNIVIGGNPAKIIKKITHNE